VANPNDAVRDEILRYLHGVHQKARSPKSAGLLISQVSKAMKTRGYKQQEVASNLDYLVQKGWVREVIEYRTFTTRAGTTQSAERRTYKISDSGIDRLEAASMYQRSDVASRVNITNIRGVTVVGSGNVVNTTFTDLSRVLTDLKQSILQEPALADDRKLDIAADIDSLEAQLQKPEPKKSIVQMLWLGIEKAAAVGGAIDILNRAAALIQPLLK
jgi:hypothetical protein